MPKGELGKHMKAVKSYARERKPIHVEQLVHRGLDHAIGHATD